MRAGEEAGLRFLTPSPVKQLRLVAVLKQSEEGAVSLPWEVRWALSLNEGDVLAFDEEDYGVARVRFRSLEERSRAAIDCCENPEPFLSELLRLPLASLGPAGALSLSGLALACTFAPSEALLLRAQVGHGEPSFTLESASGRRFAPERLVRALYSLEVEPGLKVVLPPDALWALALAAGSAINYRTALWDLEGWTDERPAHGRLRIGEGGALLLPQKLWEYATLKPRSPVRLEVSLEGARPSFRLTPDLS